MRQRPNNRRLLRILSLLALVSFVACSACCSAQDENSTSDDLFLFRPNTPVRQVRGAILAERLERPTLAQGYLSDLINSQPDSQTLLRLRDQFGIGEFLRLATIEELQPASRELLKLINEATKREAPAAALVASLIDELGASEDQTVSASLKILAAEDQAVAPLLAADSSTTQGRLADALLKKYARRFRYGLLRELQNSNPKQQVRILKLLATTSDSSIAFDLLPYRFSEDPIVAAAAVHTTTYLNPRTANCSTAAEAAELLYNEVLELLQTAGTPFPSVRVERELAAATDDRPADDDQFGQMSLTRAAALSRLAAEILPNSPKAQGLQLIAELTEQSWPARWPDNLARQEQSASEPAIEAFDIAATSGNTGSLIAVLSQPTATDVLKKRKDLLRYCRFYPDIRVRFAAEYLVGNSDKLTELREIVRSGSTKPELVLIDSRESRIRGGAAVLSDLGYAVHTAFTGQSGLKTATNLLRPELILIQSNSYRWPLSTTIANLRADYRTRHIPIVVFGPLQDRDSIDHVQQRHGGIWFLREPLSELTFAEAIRLSGVPAPQLSEDERKRMIDFARTAP